MLPSVEVDYILTECCITLGQNLKDLPVSPEAARFWRDRYRECFLATLSSERPRVWEEDRLNVLAKAAALGRAAAALATADGSSAIGLSHARQASEENDCRPRSRYGLFSIWCVPPGSRAEAADATCAQGSYHRLLHALVRG